MKLLLIATLMMSFAYAEDAKKDLNGEVNISQIKERILSNIEEKIKLLQTQKACIQAVTNKDQLQTCRKSHQDAMKKIHSKNKDERKEFKSDRAERREGRERRGRPEGVGKRKGGRPSQKDE